MTRHFSFITVHPKIVEAYGAFGVLRSAAQASLAEIAAIDLRNYAVDKHASIDASPYGGGDGMILRPEPLRDAVQAEQARIGQAKVIFTAPGAKLWTHADAEHHARSGENFIFVCGRFGGVDERFIRRYVDYQYSLGDFVCSGGELPSLLMLDSILRFVPGVLGHGESAQNDSFGTGCDGGLEFPQYTRPPVFEGEAVPAVLTSGDHAKIASWRRAAAQEKTARLRPDLRVFAIGGSSKTR